MKFLLARLRAIRGAMLGLDATHARFDILQRKLDAVSEAMGACEAAVRQFAVELERRETPSAGARRLPVECPTRRRRSRPGSAQAPAHEGQIVERIGFLVHSAELINHFGCVWDLLPRNSFDVLLHGEGQAADPAVFERW